MAGLVLVEGFTVEATSGRMLVTFQSGGDAFRFHLPPHLGLQFRDKVMRDAWQIVCAPSGEVTKLRSGRQKK